MQRRDFVKGLLVIPFIPGEIKTVPLQSGSIVGARLVDGIWYRFPEDGTFTESIYLKNQGKRWICYE